MELLLFVQVVSAGVVVFGSSLADAWLFWRSYPSARANGKAVDEQCLELAKQGSCEFYQCFERRLKCGRNWYNLKYGEPYCLDFQAFVERFSDKGQRFINASESCIAGELVSWYQRDRINCHDYTHFAFKALSRCYMRSGFCDAVKEDAINFATIYRPKHLFSRGALKIWMEIIRLAYFCDPRAVKDILSTFYTALTN